MAASKDLKCYMQIELVTRRAELGLTQEKMAENMGISSRSYSDLEHGKNLCSLETFSHYVENCKADAYKLLSDIAEISSKSKA